MFEKCVWVKSFYKYLQAQSKEKQKLETFMNIKYSESCRRENYKYLKLTKTNIINFHLIDLVR